MSILTTTQEMDLARHFYGGQNLPKRAWKIMAAATAELESNPAASRALPPGDIAPDFILPSVDGRGVRLYSELERGPVVLVFYRGNWCPFCKIHLQGFQKLHAAFQAAGALLMVISPQLPDQSLITREHGHLAFPVLSDVGLNTARAFGVAFELPPALLKLYSGLEISLTTANGVAGSKELPMPATFVIRGDRTIDYAHVEADYTRRSEPREVLNLVRKLQNITV